MASKAEELTPHRPEVNTSKDDWVVNMKKMS